MRVVNALLRDATAERAAAYLNVLDCNTTHFVGIDGSCRGKLGEVFWVLSMAASKVVARWPVSNSIVGGSLAPAHGNTSARY
jgi:hypothetical protein